MINRIHHQVQTDLSLYINTTNSLVALLTQNTTLGFALFSPRFPHVKSTSILSFVIFHSILHQFLHTQVQYKYLACPAVCLTHTSLPPSRVSALRPSSTRTHFDAIHSAMIQPQA